MADYTLKYTGEEIDDAIGKAKSGKMQNPEPLIINGTSYDGSKRIEMQLSGGSSSGDVPAPSAPYQQLVTRDDMSIHWEPRLAYDETIYILPTTTLTEDDAATTDYYFLPHLSLVEGESYVVMYNGVKYDCVAKSCVLELGADEVTFLYIGEGVGYGAEATGEPFRISYNVSASGTPALLTYDGASTITISIAQTGAKTIDPKYLPGQLLQKANSSEIQVCIWNGYMWGPMPISVFKAMLENVT